VLGDDLIGICPFLEASALTLAVVAEPKIGDVSDDFTGLLEWSNVGDRTPLLRRPHHASTGKPNQRPNTFSWACFPNTYTVTTNPFASL
jgi:hypothetical protein